MLDVLEIEEMNTRRWLHRAVDAFRKQNENPDKEAVDAASKKAFPRSPELQMRFRATYKSPNKKENRIQTDALVADYLARLGDDFVSSNAEIEQEADRLGLSEKQKAKFVKNFKRATLYQDGYAGELNPVEQAAWDYARLIRGEYVSEERLKNKAALVFESEGDRRKFSTIFRTYERILDNSIIIKT